jgi:hypothetical protein
LTGIDEFEAAGTAEGTDSQSIAAGLQLPSLLTTQEFPVEAALRAAGLDEIYGGMIVGYRYPHNSYKITKTRCKFALCYCRIDLERGKIEL